jgi:hypothetical protein
MNQNPTQIIKLPKEMSLRIRTRIIVSPTIKP